jgi:hypothetical protein
MDELFPDGEYRPIPIVWFAGAFVAQVALLFIAFFAFYALEPAYTVGVSALITIYIGWRTWRRGMKRAAVGWKLATFLVLLLNWALVSLAAQDRIPFS